MNGTVDVLHVFELKSSPDQGRVGGMSKITFVVSLPVKSSPYATLQKDGKRV